MPRSKTYSFPDMAGAFAHPSVGTFQFVGQGVKQVSIHMATEKTTHDVAADGVIMPSKIVGDNGTISIEVQQTSAADAFLQEWYNYCEFAPASEWASAGMTIRNPTTMKGHEATGISPQNEPDRTYAAQGGTVTWVLMACDIQNYNA